MSELRDALVALRDKYAGRAWVTGHDINDIVASLDAILSSPPAEEPNELTRQTMTASEAGENVVSFENMDDLIADLDSPSEEAEPAVIGRASFGSPVPADALRACELLIEYEDSMDGAEQGDGKEEKYWQSVLFARAALRESGKEGT